MDDISSFYLFFGCFFSILVGLFYGLFVFDGRFWALRGKVRESCLRVKHFEEWERFERIALSNVFVYALILAAPVMVPLAHLYLCKFERRYSNVR